MGAAPERRRYVQTPALPAPRDARKLGRVDGSRVPLLDGPLPLRALPQRLGSGRRAVEGPRRTAEAAALPAVQPDQMAPDPPGFAASGLIKARTRPGSDRGAAIAAQIREEDPPAVLNVSFRPTRAALPSISA